MPDIERRRQQRFPLVVPANVSIGGHGADAAMQLQTRNISSAGAFLDAREPLSKGTRVTVALFLTVKSLLEIIRAEAGARIQVRGRVIRCTEDGFAVAFSRGFKIRPMLKEVKR